MIRKSLVLLFTILLLSTFVLAQDKNAGAKHAAGPPSVDLMKTVLDAWGTMNLEDVGSYYDHSPSDVFYDISPVKYQGWSEYAAGAQPLFATLKSISFTLNDDAIVHRAGKLAWGTSTVRTVMTDKAGKDTRLDCRWTVVWQKKGGQWLIVHDHFSAPVEPPK